MKFYDLAKQLIINGGDILIKVSPYGDWREVGIVKPLNDKYFTTDELADYLQVRPRYIGYNRIRKKKGITPPQLGKRVFVYYKGAYMFDGLNKAAIRLSFWLGRPSLYWGNVLVTTIYKLEEFVKP